MVGGAYLCYEGFEKLAHKFAAQPDEDARPSTQSSSRRSPIRHVDLVAFEKDKIKGAIRTDFILSAEIIVITLGTVDGTPFVTQEVACSSASRSS